MVLESERERQFEIIEQLRALEAERGIRILFAVETGSRAWGFPSRDSDYDLRFVYVETLDWYLDIEEGQDQCSGFSEDRVLDYSGWELRKALRLLRKGNPSLTEWLQSPMVYWQEPEAMSGLWALARQYHSRISSVYHYLSLSKKCYAELIEGRDYKLKHFFYALRSLASARWVLEREDCPPMVLMELLEGFSFPNTAHVRLCELVALKAEVDECYRHSGEEELVAWMAETLSAVEEGAARLPAPHRDKEALNAFYRAWAFANLRP